MSERRNFTRILLSGEVELHSKDKVWSSHLIDISLKGALITIPEQFKGQAGDSINLNIFMESVASIQFEGQITHIGAKHLGLKSDRMDIDSMTELRRLIELNMGNDSLLHRELHTLVAVSDE
ncbi:PilZ domain-containing protein [Paraneptunicella aestuarii]|uniref:PilZ domain-containing protein n=1 Tax=Paraneptunicella aestuarii TaxID=2831148 RepID=UPI001E392199|nr:PilZ domain-containing protein [Paraneptunicella aestuarii]UAA40021.1 PilZ domain-containing protein [Paraneptunicella aestuarii]